MFWAKTLSSSLLPPLVSPVIFAAFSAQLFLEVMWIVSMRISRIQSWIIPLVFAAEIVLFTSCALILLKMGFFKSLPLVLVLILYHPSQQNEAGLCGYAVGLTCLLNTCKQHRTDKLKDRLF